MSTVFFSRKAVFEQVKYIKLLPFISKDCAMGWPESSNGSDDIVTDEAVNFF